jgi:hypothetical protein
MSKPPSRGHPGPATTGTDDLARPPMPTAAPVNDIGGRHAAASRADRHGTGGQAPNP